MSTPEFNSLLALLLLLHPAFTQASLLRFHAVTKSLVASGVSGRRHHAAFHRFFSHARWSLDELGRLLLVPLAAMARARAPGARGLAPPPQWPEGFRPR
jgi:hypothetical protein